MTKFKPTKPSIAACAALLISSVPAFAGGVAPEIAEPAPVAPVVAAPQTDSGYYVSVFAGAHSLSDVETTNVGSDYTVELDTGFVAGLTVGRRITDTIRVEAELSFASVEADSYDYGYDTFDAFGDLNTTYLLANVWYDFPTTGPLGYYAGGGIGAARVDADLAFFNEDSDFGYQGGETKLAAQLGAGIIYDVSQSLALDVGYRFKYVDDVDFDDGTGGNFEGGDVESHSLQAGLTFSF